MITTKEKIFLKSSIIRLENLTKEQLHMKVRSTEENNRYRFLERKGMK